MLTNLIVLNVVFVVFNLAAEVLVKVWAHQLARIFLVAMVFPRKSCGIDPFSC
jgi:hypothetical protein